MIFGVGPVLCHSHFVSSFQSVVVRRTTTRKVVVFSVVVVVVVVRFQMCSLAFSLSLSLSLSKRALLIKEILKDAAGTLDASLTKTKNPKYICNPKQKFS